MTRRRKTLPYRKGKPGVRLVECATPGCFHAGPWETGFCPEHTTPTKETK